MSKPRSTPGEVIGFSTREDGFDSHTRYMKDKTVFVLTTLFLSEISRINRSRTPGVYENLEDAKEAVVENYGDIAEVGYYNYAVIEEMPLGLYPMAKSEHWFKIETESNGDFKQATQCTKPEALKGVVSFGIG